MSANDRVVVTITAATLMAACASSPSARRPGPRTEGVLRTTGTFQSSVELSGTDGMVTDDNYQVFLWLETRVTPSGADPSRAVVQSTVRATASPLAVKGNPVPCASRGRLEFRVSELLRARLAAAGG